MEQPSNPHPTSGCVTAFGFFRRFRAAHAARIAKDNLDPEKRQRTKEQLQQWHQDVARYTQVALAVLDDSLKHESVLLPAVRQWALETLAQAIKDYVALLSTVYATYRLDFFLVTNEGALQLSPFYAEKIALDPLQLIQTKQLFEHLRDNRFRLNQQEMKGSKARLWQHVLTANVQLIRLVGAFKEQAHCWTEASHQGRREATETETAQFLARHPQTRERFPRVSRV